mmetsp:Transcript_3688/g.8801  ORF Transcript_3688/g.8801 Transcript_3688/m.8801 type:complete len:88 (-) Transcript_3688:46-309(-)
MSVVMTRSILSTMTVDENADARRRETLSSCLQSFTATAALLIVYQSGDRYYSSMCLLPIDSLFCLFMCSWSGESVESQVRWIDDFDR